MAERGELARSHGPFPAVADKTLPVPIGAGQVVQLVSGAQAGLLLAWQDPNSADFNLAGAIAADRPGVAIAAAVDSVWLVWPPVLRSSESVTLRSWSRSPGHVPPAWERSGREEVEHLAEGEQVTVPGNDAGLVLFDSEDTQRVPGTIELRRFSSVTVWCAFKIATPIVTTDVDLVLQIQTGGTWWSAYSTPAERKAVWQWGSGTSPGTSRRMASVTWPIPFARWRIRLNNSDSISAKADFHVFRTSSQFARQTV